MNVDRDEAEKLLGRKPVKKKRKARGSSFFESTWVLLGSLLLAVAAAVWFMLPLSEAALRGRAETLLASQKWTDWNTARDAYLSEIVDRFPTGQHAQWAQQQLDWVAAREAERRLERGERLGRQDGWSEAQMQFTQARRFERFGDFGTAQDKYQAIVNLFSDSPEDRPIALLAQEGLLRLKDKPQGSSGLQEFLEVKLDEAQTAVEEERLKDAQALLESMIELYADNQLVADQIDQARQLLDDIQRR